MVNYKNGKIYRLVSKHSPIPYYGSTCTDLRKRLYKHKSSYLLQNDNCTFHKLIELGDYKIELVENYPCNSRRELELREAYWIKNNLCVNKVIPAITEEERKEYKKKYRDSNKDRQKKWHAEWYEKNRDDQLIKNKEKWAKNKNEYNKIIECDCGGTYMQRGKNRHLKTQKHKAYLIDK